MARKNDDLLIEDELAAAFLTDEDLTPPVTAAAPMNLPCKKNQRMSSPANWQLMSTKPTMNL